MTCPPDALVSAGSSRSRVGEIQLDGGTAIGNMKIAIAGHLLRRIHRSVLLSSRERLWLAQTPTRDIFPEVTRHIRTGRRYIISWNPPDVNRFSQIKMFLDQ